MEQFVPLQAKQPIETYSIYCHVSRENSIICDLVLLLLSNLFLAKNRD